MFAGHSIFEYNKSTWRGVVNVCMFTSRDYARVLTSRGWARMFTSRDQVDFIFGCGYPEGPSLRIICYPEGLSHSSFLLEICNLEI